MDADMKYCRSCGKIIPKTSKFCRYCGYQYAGADEVCRKGDSPKSSPVKAALPKKKKSTGRKAASLLLVAVLLFTGFVKPGFFKKREGVGKETVISENSVSGKKITKK